MFKKTIVIASLAMVLTYGISHQSIISSAAAALEDCDFSDAELNSGFGWDPVGMVSCAPEGSGITPISNVGPVGPQGPEGPEGPAALTVGADIGVVAITGTDINSSGRDQTRVAPGELITVNFDYSIVASPGCPGCIDQIQVGIVARDGEGGPQDCAYDGVPGLVGVTNSGSVTLTAPDSMGTYYIVFDRAQHFSCELANSAGTFWSGAPGVDHFIGAISVY